MLGAIIGDVVGSIYEFDNIHTKDFPLFDECSMYTDDTVCTIALADCLMNDGNPVEYLQDYCKKYPSMSYGAMFNEWIYLKDPKPYHSFGNGAAMRVSSVAFAFDDLEKIGWKAVEYTQITHNHKYGIEGALCVCKAIHFAKTALDKSFIVDLLMEYYPTFDLSETVDSIRTWYKFNETCQGTVPQALICVLYSTDFEDAIRNAVSIGGDSDTLACIVGAIAQAYYKKIPDWIIQETMNRIPVPFIGIITEFNKRYNL